MLMISVPAIVFPRFMAEKAAPLVLLEAVVAPRVMGLCLMYEEPMALPWPLVPPHRVTLCALTASCNMVQSWSALTTEGEAILKISSKTS